MISRMQNTRPTEYASSCAGVGCKPRPSNRLCRFGSLLRQMPPLLKPSNVVVPICAQMNATVPTPIRRSVTPLSGRRR